MPNGLPFPNPRRLRTSSPSRYHQNPKRLHVTLLGLTGPLGSHPKQFVDKIHPDDRPKLFAAIARLTPESPAAEVTYRALASDGSLVWLKSNGRGFFDSEGKLLRVIGVVADVTGVKRAEEALAGMNMNNVPTNAKARLLASGVLP